jgi:hypothetical protein
MRRLQLMSGPSNLFRTPPVLASGGRSTIAIGELMNAATVVGDRARFAADPAARALGTGLQHCRAGSRDWMRQGSLNVKMSPRNGIVNFVAMQYLI